MDIPDASVDEMTRIINKNGEIVDNSLHSMLDISDEDIKRMYYNMSLSRQFDEKAVKYQRKGDIGTYPESKGQEGTFVSTAMCLEDSDWLIPSYREHIAMHIVGYSLDKVLLYWKGTFEGSRVPEDANCLPPTVPIASQIPHSVGTAWSEKIGQGEVENVYMCHFGDGATSEGDFHEGLNFAGRFETPNVFICNNNQWAISLPVEDQTGVDSLAKKAESYGITGTKIDGMDPLATYLVTKKAVNKARNCVNPTLIESVEYRYGAHTTADDPSKYRKKEDLEDWKEKDPLVRLRKYMLSEGITDEDDIDRLKSKASEKIKDFFEIADNYEQPDEDQIYDYLYSDESVQVRNNIGDSYD